MRNENGHSLMEVVASLFILSIAAALFTHGMLYSSRIIKKAKDLTLESEALDMAIVKGEVPATNVPLALSFEISGSDVIINIMGQYYTSKNGIASYWLFQPDEE